MLTIHLAIIALIFLIGFIIIKKYNIEKDYENRIKNASQFHIRYELLKDDIDSVKDNYFQLLNCKSEAMALLRQYPRHKKEIEKILRKLDTYIAVRKPRAGKVTIV